MAFWQRNDNAHHPSIFQHSAAPPAKSKPGMPLPPACIPISLACLFPANQNYCVFINSACHPRPAGNDGWNGRASRASGQTPGQQGECQGGSSRRLKSSWLHGAARHQAPSGVAMTQRRLPTLQQNAALGRRSRPRRRQRRAPRSSAGAPARHIDLIAARTLRRWSLPPPTRHPTEARTQSLRHRFCR